MSSQDALELSGRSGWGESYTRPAALRWRFNLRSLFAGTWRWQRWTIPSLALSKQTCLVATALIALFTLTVGVSQGVHQLRDGWREFRAASTVVLVLSGALQAWFIQRLAREKRFTRLDGVQLKTLAVWQLVAVVVAQTVGILLGPMSEVRYLVRALVAIGWTVALSAVALPRWRKRLSAWEHRTVVHALATAAITFSCAIVTGEALFFTIDRVAGYDPLSRVSVRDHKMSPGAEFRGGIVNRQGYWDEDFRTEPNPAAMRVAVLGRDVPLSGTSSTNCLSQLERHLPGVEVYNFGLHQTSPREWVAQFDAEVARYRPQLALAFVSVGDDLLVRDELPRTYDWRSLRLVQWTAHTLNMPLFRSAGAGIVEYTSMEHEAYLRDGTQQLAVCRTPIDATMRDRWRDVTGQLRRLVKTCQKRDVALALVLVPCEFQVSTNLREVLLRRAGCKPEQLDLELPQRRLESFAYEHQVPVIDLLPYFRSANTSPFERDSRDLSPAGNVLTLQVLGGWLQSRYGSQLAGTN